MPKKRKDGMNNTAEYEIWQSMLQRCNNPNNPGYKNYGGRGIRVCKSWFRFENFYKDMGNRPQGLSMDRIDNNRGYKPSNCRWATRDQQGENRRNVHWITYKGETKTVKEWSKLIKLTPSAIRLRLNSKLPVEQVLNTVKYNKRQKEKNINFVVCFNGVYKTVGEWAKEIGIDYRTLFNRIHVSKWSIQDSLTLPIQNKSRKSKKKKISPI